MVGSYSCVVGWGMVKDAYYFSHDCNARNDPKILAIISRYGMEGYGRYWVLIEMLREQSNYKLMANAWLWDSVAMAMKCEANAAEKFVNDCIELGLLILDDFLYSPSLLRRMETFESTKKSRSDAGKKGAESRWNGNAMANALQADDKRMAKDGKVNKSKVKESKDNIPPTVPHGDEKGSNLSVPTERIHCQEVLDEYNSVCSKMPKALSMNDSRNKSIHARAKEYGRGAITEVFRYASQSPHHNGANDQGWTADFDWLIGPKNFVKMLERARSGTPPPTKSNLVMMPEKDRAKVLAKPDCPMCQGTGYVTYYVDGQPLPKVKCECWNIPSKM